MSLFQKRHYEWLADVLRTSSTRANSAHSEITREFVNALSRDNARFDRDRFLEAAGVWHPNSEVAQIAKARRSARS